MLVLSMSLSAASMALVGSSSYVIKLALSGALKPKQPAAPAYESTSMSE